MANYDMNRVKIKQSLLSLINGLKRKKAREIGQENLPNETRVCQKIDGLIV